MGKWDKVKGKFEERVTSPGTPKPFEDAKFDDKVLAARAGYASLPLKELFARLNEYDQLKDALNEQLAAYNVEVAALGQLIKTHFDNMDVHSVQTDFGKTVYLQSEPVPSVQDRPKFEEHIASDPGLDYLWSVNPQTLKTFIKGLIEQSFEQGHEAQIPPGITMYYDTSVRIKKT
jgi:hypothetical protein